jgi:hypothetical protein
MSLTLQTTLQYEIKRLQISTNAGIFDLRSIFTEINIFDNILQPCMSGHILLLDAISLNSNLLLDGSEFLEIEITKDGDNLKIHKLFKVYKQTDRRQVSESSESYLLHFISEEFVYSEQQTFSQHYRTTYSDVISKILKDKLKIKNRFIAQLEKSNGVRDIVIPQMKPIQAIVWCSKRALNSKNLPNFLFYENIDGYNLQSLTTLKEQKNAYPIFFEVKNIEGSIQREFFGARDYEIVSQYDYLENIRDGVYSGTFIGFDPVTKTIVETKNTYQSTFKDKPLNKNYNKVVDQTRDKKINTSMDTARLVAFPAVLNRTENSYIKANDPLSINFRESPQFFLIQRKAILQNLFSQRMKIVLPGNFLLSSGKLVEVKKQKNSQDQIDNKDNSIFGKYLIVGTRHIIQQNKHETLIEVATDSTNESIPKV